MKLGVMLPLDGAIEERLSDLRRLEHPDLPDRLPGGKECPRPATPTCCAGSAAKSGVEVTAVWSLKRGPKVWDFHTAPLTIGIVPGPTAGSG